MAFSLRARVVYPVDRPPIEGGVVTVESERIVAVGTTSDGDVHDLGDVALLPGLVNAHTHLEFSYLKQPLGQPHMPLVDWIRLVIAERGRGHQSLITNLLRGLCESCSWGVTTVGNISTSAETLVVGDVTHFHEVIGFSRARAESAMKTLVDRIEFLQPPRFWIKQGISPHAPYTVSPKLLKELVLRARQHDLPVAMHLAESREEIEFLGDGTGPFQELLEERSMWDGGAIPLGSRPLDYLRMLAETPRALVIHGNYLDADERGFLAAHSDRMSLVYCPRTHAYFGHAPYPLAELIASGVRVALGTDSRASNPDLSLLGEMRFMAQRHFGISPHEVLRMGTLSGAEALGRADEVGSLVPGKLANLVAVPLSSAARGTADESFEAMLADETQVSAVWVRGRRTRDTLS